MWNRYEKLRRERTRIRWHHCTLKIPEAGKFVRLNFNDGADFLLAADLNYDIRFFKFLSINVG